MLPRAPGLHHSWPVDAAGLFLLPGFHHSPITSPSLQTVAGTALGQCPPQHYPHFPALCVVMNNAEPGGLLAATGRASAGGCSFCLPRAWRGNAGSGPRQRVFTVSGEAVNSLGLIESRCCGFGLTHPPPPPPLDNVSLKPLCKLTAFLCAEHQAAGGPRPRATGTPGAHVPRGHLAAASSAPPHSSCPGPGPSWD